MSWPLKFRAMSFAVTVGVVLVESVMGSIPIALAVWYFDLASAGTLVRIFSVVVAIVVIAIAVPPHLLPSRISPGERLTR